MEDHILLHIDPYMAQFVTSLETLIIGALIGILVSVMAFLATSEQGTKKE